MGFRLNTNVAALNAHSNSVKNNNELDNSLSRLSSGLRINTAADDASGLSIANSLRSQASSLGQAISNGNDAIGLIQTADGALSEYSDILDTMKTKAVQASSDTQNTSSRLAIQKDIDRLMEELNTIATTTSFNGQKLLSGTYSNKEFQMGANANESVKLNIASTETSQIGQTSRATMTIDKEGENQLTLKSAETGKEITLASVDLQNNNDVSNGLGAVANEINKYTGETGISAKAIVESTTGDISAGTTGADFSINGVNIGDINVDVNDEGGTLQDAINSKTTQTGVSATRTEDGKLTLTSDGRGIKLEGASLESVIGAKAEDMTTMGEIEVVQTGSSTFQITGAEFENTVAGADVDITGTMSIVQDSVLESTSVIGTGSVLVEGTELGSVVTATVGMQFAGATSATSDFTLGKDSQVLGSSRLNEGTVLTTDFVSSIDNTNTLSSDMFLAAGTILGSNTTFDAGTVLNQDIVVGGNTYKAGTTLASDLTTDAQITLIEDMTMYVDLAGSAGATLGSGSTLAAGTILGLDVLTTGDVTLDAAMDFKEGSILATGSLMAGGTVLGESITITDAPITLSADMTIKAGSTLGSGSTIDEGSTIGGDAKLGADLTTNKDMTLAAGSIIGSDSILKKGTVLTQDLTADQVGGGAGTGLKAGEVLNVDLTLTADVTLEENMLLVAGSKLEADSGSTIAANANLGNSVVLENEEYSDLADIDVTTLEGAMKAIDTLSAAMADLDAIRSDLGSVQNQVTSTINNISVTQVNVTAAESQIRDVDFAEESATFNKHNLLAQSGSYAMSQANSVQQNVMSLLQ